jgi:putative peptide zinc metalloprotease protein
MELPSLRPDLKVVQSINKKGLPDYLLEDPVSGKVFVFQEKEYFICKQLDGQTPLPDVLERFGKRFGSGMELQQLEAFIRNLGEQGLIAGYSLGPSSAFHLFQYQSPEKWKRWKIFNPEKLMTWLAERLWWCYTRAFFFSSVIIFLLAVGAVSFHFTEFIDDIKVLVRPLTILQMLLVMYLFVNIPQEFARGMTGARFGGFVYEYGIWLAYDIMPRFYCLSRVWVIPEKSKRGWILFAPTFYALLIGSAGVLLWRMTTPTSVLNVLGLMVAVITVIDTCLRLNFLWPTEGYYLLANWIDAQDFRRRTIHAFQSWLFRKPMPEPFTVREKRLFILYGVLTVITTFPALAVLAYFIGRTLIYSYAGAGGLLFIGMVSVKYRRGISFLIKENKMIQWLSSKGIHSQSKKKARLIFWTVSIIVISLFPYPYEAGGPFRILPFQKIELHTQVSGEIKKILVKENDLVKKGEVQALIDVREHQKNLDSTQADLEKAEHDVESARTRFGYSSKEKKRLGILFKEGVISEEEHDAAAKQADVDEQDLQSAKAVVRDLQARVTFYKDNIELTRLLAPISGRVVTPYIDTKVGQVLKQGDLFAEYEEMETVQAEVQLPEEYIDEITIGAQVKVRPQAYPTRFFRGDVVLIAPRASDTPSGKVVRVITNIPNPKMELRPDMTGEAKIEGGWEPVIVAFTKAIVRFFMVEVWSWFP